MTCQYHVTRLLSFVIPVKDEEKTIADLAKKILSVVDAMGISFDVEIIFVDDGSNDHSWVVMCQLVKEASGRVHAIRLRRNFGKAIALMVGFQRASGDVVFTMDADLQDDPSEIPRFLEELAKGYGLVSGWKYRRVDSRFKVWSSKLFNRVTSWAVGLRLNDFNCGFKCYRREIIKAVILYGELHRYVAVYAHDLGYRVGEIKIEHFPRNHGVSKYDRKRYLRGVIDLITVLATTRWLNRPGHLFGGIGVAFGIIGAISLLYLSVIWLLGQSLVGGGLLFIFGVMFSILSVQMVSFGIIAEIFVRINNPREVDALVAEVAGDNNKPL